MSESADLQDSMYILHK